MPATTVSATAEAKFKDAGVLADHGGDSLGCAPIAAMSRPQAFAAGRLSS